MKTQVLVMMTMMALSSATFAGGNLFKPAKLNTELCRQLGEQDMGYEIGCLTGTIESLVKLNDERLARLSENADLADIKSLRNATEIRKKACSLRSAASPFGGRGQAMSNRQCFLDQEVKLEKEILQINEIAEAAKNFQENY